MNEGAEIIDGNELSVVDFPSTKTLFETYLAHFVSWLPPSYLSTAILNSRFSSIMNSMEL